MDFRGKVVLKRVAPGSKSEREAVVLVTARGDFVLRRRGGNPFVDAELSRLVGKTIRCRGEVHGQTLIVTGWEELEDEGEGS